MLYATNKPLFHTVGKNVRQKMSADILANPNHGTERILFTVNNSMDPPETTFHIHRVTHYMKVALSCTPNVKFCNPKAVFALSFSSSQSYSELVKLI